MSLFKNSLCGFIWRERQGLPRFEREARALTLNPNSATTHQWLAEMLIDVGRSEEALKAIRLAQSLDPLSPIIPVIVAKALAVNGNFEEALVQVQAALKLSPEFPMAYLARGHIRTLQKNFLAAISDLEKAREGGSLANFHTPAFIGYGYAKAGRTSDALQILSELKSAASEERGGAILIAFVYQGLGDENQVFAWLDSGGQFGCGCATPEVQFSLERSDSEPTLRRPPEAARTGQMRSQRSPITGSPPNSTRAAWGRSILTSNPV